MRISQRQTPSLSGSQLIAGQNHRACTGKSTALHRLANIFEVGISAAFANAMTGNSSTSENSMARID